jgi:lysophospholipase L1-like esterase
MRFKLIVFLLQTAIVFLISMALLEMLVALSFRYPRWSPIPMPLLQYLHIRFDRNVIQVMPDCAIHDDSVTYTLRPGRCVFSSREFSNEYRINSMGVRDDEPSLRQPQTVILGDSLAMGWGVDQDQAFPSVYERITGVRTLNAGISSYGTVRELRLLQRIDRSALTSIVIQYNENDVFENAQLIERPPFTTLTREQYQRTVEEQARLLRYIPGKYAFNVLVQLQSTLKGRQRVADVGEDRQAELFVRVIERSPVDLGPFRVTVMAVNSRFLESVRRMAATSSFPWVREMEYLDISSIAALEGGHYVLDDHPTAIGHEAIARLLAEHLNGERRPTKD